MRAKRIVLWWVVVTVAAAGWLAACGGPTPTEPPAEEQETPAEPPPGGGAMLLEERCAGCHTLDRVVQAQKSGEEWEQTVDRMIGRGASLNESERAVLIEYLAATYRP